VRFSERWNDQAACFFPDAAAAGVATDLASYLEEFHSLRRFGRESLAQVPLSLDAVEFLTQDGLPEDAPPFLTLCAPARVWRPMLELWSSASLAPALEEGLQRCYTLYSDGGGNPLCVDLGRDGAVLWFDHTDLTKCRYVNSGVVALAEFLLLRIKSPHLATAAIEGSRIDADALSPGTFWYDQGFER
jgi:hypothetical protein